MKRRALAFKCDKSLDHNSQTQSRGVLAFFRKKSAKTISTQATRGQVKSRNAQQQLKNGCAKELLLFLNGVWACKYCQNAFATAFAAVVAFELAA